MIYWLHNSSPQMPCGSWIQLNRGTVWAGILLRSRKCLLFANIFYSLSRHSFQHPTFNMSKSEAEFCWLCFEDMLMLRSSQAQWNKCASVCLHSLEVLWGRTLKIWACVLCPTLSNMTISSCSDVASAEEFSDAVSAGFAIQMKSSPLKNRTLK